MAGIMGLKEVPNERMEDNKDISVGQNHRKQIYKISLGSHKKKPGKDRRFKTNEMSSILPFLQRKKRWWVGIKLILGFIPSLLRGLE
jgi:hypothetical protein